MPTCATGRLPPALPSALVQIALFNHVLSRKHSKPFQGRILLQMRSDCPVLSNSLACKLWRAAPVLGNSHWLQLPVLQPKLPVSGCVGDIQGAGVKGGKKVIL